ncbi:ATP-dependent zinc metalloprotease FtsH [Candidatus Manganitrophus noduliformans]|uniref:ATP-dependent zinc metalloprotease FtsH n=1 Tax=Candidatus Manganitrophus noduliformans TaxID=2606439 RepID=A0A7X6DPG7_9BACT|nr:ATP-dependent zinc metalloprotease FtsH [Candidatus Manganitrophus noduliformans]NKE70683.1 ATP-dependent metallopeptidase FtsH/Yme1/Tma family protein [Candidatus Manganitrophus noduliformans]
MNPRFKNLAPWIVVALFMILLYNLFNTSSRPIEDEIIFSDFMAKTEKGEVSEVTIKDNYISGILKDGTKFKTYSAAYPDLVKNLREKNVRITAKPPEEPPWYMTFLMTWGPFILFVGLWIFFMRQMQVGGNKALSFGKSRARLLSEDRKKITFSDVAGIDEAKGEVEEIIEFLKDPPKFQKLGGRIPKGVLVVGPPGTGKTLLAKAIAGEAGVPFFSISGSDFVEMFVGVGASRVRDLFEQGKKHAPCIIFIDEIDAVGRHRGAGLGGGHDEREQTLNQLLVEMDGFETSEGVILIAATNRPDVLDPALLRPGRFDRQIVVGRPDLKGRVEILKVHTKRIPISPDVGLEIIARGTPGFAGADLENLVNEAALLAARRGKKTVEMNDFEAAKDKVLMGVERRSMVISEEEKRITAVHEAGHTLIAKLLPGTDPIHKVTIIPRGRALGVTMQLPTDDRHNYHKEYLYNTIAIMMGGRVAEELVLNNVTTGAGNDIEKATDLARKMVCEWGMSEKMGPLTFGKKEQEIFLGREINQHRDYSEYTAIEIDNEVRRLVTENYERAKTLITNNMKALKALAEALLEKESLDAPEIDRILQSSISPSPA